MPNTRRTMITVGALALLLIGAQIWFGQAQITQTNAVAGGVLASTPIPLLTPVVASADPLGRSGVPGGPSDIVVPPDSNIPSGRVFGAPAIKPSIHAVAANVPAFTVADVVAYHNSITENGTVDSAGFDSSSTPVKMVKAEFLTASSLAALDSQLIFNLPADALLCLVQYSGAFTGSMSDYNPDLVGQQPIVHPFVVEVYDAQTGNLMAAGERSTLIGNR